MPSAINTAEDTAKFLSKVANLPERHWLLGDANIGVQNQSRRVAQVVKEYPSIFVDNEHLAVEIGEQLRRIWTVADDWERGRLIYKLDSYYRGFLNVLLDPPEFARFPPGEFAQRSDAFRAVLVYLLRNQHRLKKCRNKDCDTEPYFLDARKDHCSPSCKNAAHKQRSRVWMQEKRMQARQKKKRRTRK